MSLEMKMGEKRKHGSAFQVGPANLPDGTRKRKADRIKQALIDRAKIKQDFAKVKKRKIQQGQDDETPTRNVYDAESDVLREAVSIEPTPTEPHPDRQALINGPAPEPEVANEQEGRYNQRWERDKRLKQDPYAKQTSYAQKQKEEADRRRQEREEANRQREQKIQEREKIQKMVRKAKRPTVDGKRKLGRESEFLLEKVKRMVKG
jgi:hypothetical protein